MDTAYTLFRVLVFYRCCTKFDIVPTGCHKTALKYKSDLYGPHCTGGVS